MTVLRVSAGAAATVSAEPHDRQKRVEDMGVKIVGHYLTMGQYDQIVICDAPDDETVAKVTLLVAGRGNVATETVRAFTMDEVRKLI